MPRTVSPEAMEAMFAETTSTLILPFLTIEESQLAEPIRLVNNPVDLTRNGHVYTALGFEVTPPSEESGTVSVVNIRVDNTNFILRDAIELAQERPKFTLEYVRDNAGSFDDVPEYGPVEMLVESASYNLATVEIGLRYTETFQLRYPQHGFIPAFFPDLFD